MREGWSYRGMESRRQRESDLKAEALMSRELKMERGRDEGRGMDA